MNAITFTLLQDGIPITYYGQEQHLNGSGVPQNRQALWSSGGYNTESTLYGMISKVNAIRTHAIETANSFVTDKIQTPYFDDHTIVTRKGETGAQIVAVYSNLGESGSSYSLPLTKEVTGFTDNQDVMEILTCTLLKTSASGDISVPLEAGQPKVLFSYAGIKGSKICDKYTSE
jgi:alpha-amylase